MAGSWGGIKVRHADGRKGTIRSDGAGHMHRGLTIAVDDGTSASVQLNADGPDSGETGWRWLCEGYGGHGAWLRLGDHNVHMDDAELVRLAPGQSAQ